MTSAKEIYGALKAANSARDKADDQRLDSVVEVLKKMLDDVMNQPDPLGASALVRNAEWRGRQILAYEATLRDTEPRDRARVGMQRFGLSSSSYYRCRAEAVRVIAQEKRNGV